MNFSAQSSLPGHIRLENGASQNWGRDKKLTLTSDNIIDATSSLTLNGSELHLDAGQLTVDGILEVQSGSRVRVRRGKLTGTGQIKINRGGVLELASDTVSGINELAGYRGRLNVVNHGFIYGQGVIDGDLTVEEGGSITLATQPIVMSSTTNSLPPVSTLEIEDFSTMHTPRPDPTLIVVIGGLGVSGTVNETITPTAYGQMKSRRSISVSGATLNISLTTAPAASPFTFPAAGQLFDMLVAPTVSVLSNFVPSPPNVNSSHFYFLGKRVLSDPFAPGNQAYLLTTHV